MDSLALSDGFGNEFRRVSTVVLLCTHFEVILFLSLTLQSELNYYPLVDYCLIVILLFLLLLLVVLIRPFIN